MATVSILRRGIEIFILAFLFRLQAFIVSPGSSPITLFRVDILNVMGPSIAAAGLIWGLWRSRAAVTLMFAVMAAACAMATPLVRVAVWVNALPVWVQWYVRPAGDYTNFTLFPWVGFVFAGGAVGVLIAAARDPRAERRVQWSLAAAGAMVAGCGFYTASLPSIYRQSSFWTSSPTYFAIRAGVLLIALAVTHALARGAARRGTDVVWLDDRFIVTLGANHALRLWEAVIAYVAFCGLIYGFVLLRDRLVGRWRSRGPAASPLFSRP